MGVESSGPEGCQVLHTHPRWADVPRHLLGRATAATVSVVPKGRGLRHPSAGAPSAHFLAIDFVLSAGAFQPTCISRRQPVRMRGSGGSWPQTTGTRSGVWVDGGKEMRPPESNSKREGGTGTGRGQQARHGLGERREQGRARPGHGPGDRGLSCHVLKYPCTFPQAQVFPQVCPSSVPSVTRQHRHDGKDAAQLHQTVATHASSAVLLILLGIAAKKLHWRGAAVVQGKADEKKKRLKPSSPLWFFF